MKKQNIHHYLYLTFICIFIIMILLDPMNLFGSKTDWINQHTVFPDYFRKLFYETGNLIPSFGANIGAGQNIFNFSYYGLLNPIILFSYLFPKISMTDYLIGANIILYTTSALLLYTWLRNHTKTSNHAFYSTIITILSASFLFHFHRHFMFVNYMPFLILGLIGIDKYFKDGTRFLYALSTFLMIMISYYYSIIGIVIFVLYGIYHYIKQENKLSVKSFFQVGIPFLIPIFIGIIMACILLFPTAYVILTSRSNAGLDPSIKDLLLPKLNLGSILYQNYSLGLTSISLIALLYCAIKKEAHTKFLALTFIIIITFPIFIYLLNGTLYIRNKILIPFLPIMALFLLKFFDDLFSKKIDLFKLFGFTSIVLALSLLLQSQNWYFYVDIVIIICCILSAIKWNKKLVLIVPCIIIGCCSIYSSEKNDAFVTKDLYQEMFDKGTEKRISNTLDKEKKMVRFAQLDYTLYTINYIYHPSYYNTSLYSSTYHNDYDNFFKNVFSNPLPYRNQLILGQTNNIMFQTFMGIKYINYNGTAPVGYQLVDNKTNSDMETSQIYQNKNVLPIGYATSNIINEKEFDKLTYPDTNEVLIGNAIVSNQKSTIDFQSHRKEIHPTYQKIGFDNPNLTITKKDSGYVIEAKEDTTVTLRLDQKIKDQILFIDFKINNQTSCSSPDQKIKINGVMNKLTCKEWEYQNENDVFHFALSRNRGWYNLNITFGKGTYEIDDIHLSLLDYQVIKDQVNTVDAWNVEKQDAKGNTITGDINVKNDGYFVTSIPYDKGFTVYLDGKKISYEKINKAFLGFPISKGKHTVKLVYQAPFLDVGIIGSTIGMGLFAILCFIDFKNYKKRLVSKS